MLTRRLAVLAGLLSSWVLAAAASAQSLNTIPSEARPKNLILLEERQVRGGKQATGVYGATADPSEPGLWRIKVWEELPDDIKVRTESIRCNPDTPMRITSDGRNLIVLDLNPGGQITPGNRLHHMIWWATCFPEQAGKDPATLGAVARQLGYPGHLQERRQVLPGSRR
ncbi:hypothetical protein KQ310_04550 [Synechococcus sp. CS-1328]|nr:hypothetical protein [Synechococcus sp. CS-1328]